MFPHVLCKTIKAKKSFDPQETDNNNKTTENGSTSRAKSMKPSDGDTALGEHICKCANKLRL